MDLLRNRAYTQHTTLRSFQVPAPTATTCPDRCQRSVYQNQAGEQCRSPHAPAGIRVQGLWGEARGSASWTSGSDDLGADAQRIPL